MAISACIWAKNEMRSQMFSNESSCNMMLNENVHQWDLSVNVTGEKIICQVKLNSNGVFEVSFTLRIILENQCLICEIELTFFDFFCKFFAFQIVIY